MTEERKEEIKAESKRRLELWLSATSFDEMTVSGSFKRFDMALGLFMGYPFEKEKWMNEEDFGGFVTEKEFYSREYEEILRGLFNEAILNSELVS